MSKAAIIEQVLAAIDQNHGIEISVHAKGVRVALACGHPKYHATAYPNWPMFTATVEHTWDALEADPSILALSIEVAASTWNILNQ